MTPHTTTSSTTKPNSNNPFIPSSPSVHHPPQTFQQLLPQIPLHPSPARQFPPTINLYRDAFPTAPQRRFFLGPHQSHPLYAVSAWIAGWGAAQASLLLHNGPSEDAAPLATAAYDSWGRSVRVSLPPLPGRERDEQPIPVTMPSVMGGHTVAFVVEVPWPENGAVVWRKEAFEWRRSAGAVISGLGGSSSGWKLVRLTNALPPGVGGGGTVPGAAGTGPPSGDGHEVVAVCSNAVMSVTKLWKFGFLGTGFSGVLGERWAVMAVMTALVLWDREARR